MRAFNEDSLKNFILADAEVGDLDEILSIIFNLNLSVWTRSDLIVEIGDEFSFFKAIKLKPQKEVIGFILARLIISESIAEILNVGVVENQQGKGFGKILIGVLCNHCLTRGITDIWLEVRSENQKALDFYHRHGFAEQYTRKNYYVDPTDDALLLKLSYGQN